MRDKERGQGLVEYALILALVAIVAALALGALGISLEDAYEQVLAALGGEVATECETHFETSFDKEVNWVEVTSGFWGRYGRWKIEDDKLVSPRLGLVLLTDYSGSDYQISLDEIESNDVRSTWNGYAVFFRARMDNRGRIEGYAFEFERVSRWSPYRMYFSYWSRGVQVPLNPPGYVSPPGGWQSAENLTISVEGDTFVAKMNGQEILRASDGRGLYNDGFVGLASNFGSTVSFEAGTIESPTCE